MREMKRFFLIAVLSLASICLACAKGVEGGSKPTDYQVSVSGRVTCQGQPVADAVVSDGIEIVRTDADGRYSLFSPGRMGYVFITVPSGYKVANKGVLPGIMSISRAKRRSMPISNYFRCPIKPIRCS